MLRMRVFLSLLLVGFSFQTVLAEELSFEDRVRAFILDNPEIILEALTVLSERDAEAALQARLSEVPELFAGTSRLGEGDALAPIRVIEFFDYKCLPCKAAHPRLVALVDANPEIRLEMRHLPILTPGSEWATRFALATEAVHGTEAYRAVHDRLWRTNGPLNTPVFRRIARELDLDFDSIEPAMDSEAVDTRIEFNRDIAITLEGFGTPAFVTPNSVVVGSTDVEALSEVWLSQ